MSLYNSVKSNSNSEFSPIRLKYSSWDKFNLFVSNLNNMNSKLKVGMTVSVVINTEFKKDIPIIIRPISNLFYKFQTL